MKTYTIKDSRYPLGGGAFLVVPGDLVEHPNNGGEWVRTEDVRRLLGQIVGCFTAAETEGLIQVLAETPDERLKDLVERRLRYAPLYAQDSGLI